MWPVSFSLFLFFTVSISEANTRAQTQFLFQDWFWILTCAELVEIHNKAFRYNSWICGTKSFKTTLQKKATTEQQNTIDDGFVPTKSAASLSRTAGVLFQHVDFGFVLVKCQHFHVRRNWFPVSNLTGFRVRQWQRGPFSWVESHNRGWQEPMSAELFLSGLKLGKTSAEQSGDFWEQQWLSWNLVLQ